jgi:hypothetical protein
MADLIPPSQVAEVWPRVSAGLAVALDRFEEHSIGDALAEILAGRWMLWTCDVGAALTMFATFPRRRVLYVIALSGEGNGVEVIAAIKPALDAHAKRHGCAAVQTTGRPGWRRSPLRPAECRHMADVYEWSL